MYIGTGDVNTHLHFHIAHVHVCFVDDGGQSSKLQFQQGIGYVFFLWRTVSGYGVLL